MAPAVEPFTGLPYSDKSKVAAGLLQLLLGGFLVLGGVGRLYAGHVTLGVIQLGFSVVAWLAACCAAVLVVPIIITIGVWAWFVVDGIVLLAGRPLDRQGLPLR